MIKKGEEFSTSSFGIFDMPRVLLRGKMACDRGHWPFQQQGYNNLATVSFSCTPDKNYGNTYRLVCFGWEWLQGGRKWEKFYFPRVCFIALFICIYFFLMSEKNSRNWLIFIYNSPSLFRTCRVTINAQYNQGKRIKI